MEQKSRTNEDAIKRMNDLITVIKSNIKILKGSVIINYELERLILSYADSVIVIKPSHLVAQIQHRLSNASSNYMK